MHAEILTDEVRDRLARLNRRLPAGPGTSRAARQTSSPFRAENDRSTLPAGREVENEHGRHWVVEAPLDEVCRGGANLLDRPARDDAMESSVHTELSALARHVPRSVVFLDLETCGLAGTAIFLVGLVHHDTERLSLTQLFARDYTEEKAVLHSLWQRLADKQVLVSFNGKSFDWPMVQDRTALYGLYGNPPTPFVHCDLLHHARRRWKGQLADCRLQTLEQHVCGRRRVGDILGRDVPHAYHQFVRSGDSREIRAILHHNALDLVTLLQLAAALLRPPTG